MRALLDTNVLISNLFSANADTSATGVVLRAAIEDRYTLLLIDGVVEELYRKLDERPDLAARISRAQAETVAQSLARVSATVPRLSEPFPSVVRDANDDFLIAHALAANADYLVSWDKDLHEMGEFDDIKLISPPDFLQALRQAERE